MFFKQYYLACLSHASYMIADEESGAAIVVDPQRDIDEYVHDAATQGFRITHVILTHFHADFLAGHIELRDKVGAKICLGAMAEAEFEFLPLADGDGLSLGRVQLKIMATPGHTPEGISIVVSDQSNRTDAPYAVLTGDTLFIGDVGRPDLLASIGVTAIELSEMLYDSVQNKLAKLPPETMVYPAHGAGSMCGRNLSDETVSTIGEQLIYNYAMQPMSLEQFQAVVLEDQPDTPDYFVHDAILNRQERPNLTQAMESSLKGLSLEALIRHQTRKVQLVDVRDAVDFEAAHIRGALNIGLRGKFATWAGTMLKNDERIVVIADPGDEEEAIMRLGRIGFDNVPGYLKNGMAAVGERDGLLNSVDRITARAAMNEIDSAHPPTVVDVRTVREREAGFVPGSIHIPLNELTDRLEVLGRAQHLIMHCQGGYRSAIACSLLLHHGFHQLQDLVGGFNAWKTSGLPVQTVEHAVT